MPSMWPRRTPSSMQGLCWVTRKSVSALVLREFKSLDWAQRERDRGILIFLSSGAIWSFEGCFVLPMSQTADDLNDPVVYTTVS